MNTRISVKLGREKMKTKNTHIFRPNQAQKFETNVCSNGIKVWRGMANFKGATMIAAQRQNIIEILRNLPHQVQMNTTKRL